MSLDNHPARRLLSAKQVCALMSFSRTTLWRKVRDGKFPAPVKTGENSSRFYEDEIAEIQADLPRVRYAPPASAEAVAEDAPAAA